MIIIIVTAVETSNLTYGILVEILLGKLPLGRRGRSWEDNIKIDFRKKCTGGTWIELAQYCVH
jgi:Na+/H+ antiporter NhaA